MSQEQENYVTEAMNLLSGEPAAVIEQPRTKLVLRDGIGEEWTAAWVKLSTAFKPHIKELRGAPLAIWLYISLSINKQGVAFPGIRTIAEDTGYSHQGVLDAIKTLEEKGYLHVRRGEKRYNLYEPEFSAIGKTNEPTGSVNSLDSLSQVLPLNESSTLDLNKRLTRKNKKDKNLLDGILFYAEQGKEQGIDEVESILVQLERGLRVNIDRSLKNQQVAKRIMKDGRPLDTWLTWCKSDEWRLAHLYLYADLERVWRDYPQAFDNNSGYNPQGLSIE